MKKLVTISLIFLALISFSIFINHNEKKINSLKNVKKCNKLNYEKNQLNKIDNFSNFEVDLIIENERKWKKIILNTHLSGYEDRSFTYDAKYSDAKIILKNKFGLRCSMKAKIKPHGDLLDHYRDFGPGYDPIYALPSLKVKLNDGNIFGIVEFRLLVPKTRQNGNEIFVTTLFQKLGFYAPRTTYVNLNYNNKKYKFLFQEKLNKEFLEINSLHEGLFFAGDERFSFKYENVSKINGKIIQEKEIGISKFRIAEIKFLKKNEIFIESAIDTLQVLNVASHFYSSDIKQSLLIDYFTTQKNKIYESYFKNIPEFDAMMYAVGADHGLSRDDRRFYFDVLNKNFIPIYNDGAVRIFSSDEFKGSNFHSDVEKRLKSNKKFSNSSRVGASSLINKIDKVNQKDLKKILNQRGLNVPTSDLKLIIELIRKNLMFLSNLNDNQIVEVSNLTQHPLINKKAFNKNIKAAYLFSNNESYQKCDLLLVQCINIELNQKELLLALKQNLEDKKGNKLIFLGDLNEFKKLKKTTSNSNKIETYTFDNITFKIFGEIDVEVNEDTKNLKFFKKKPNSRILFYESFLKDWKIEFIDLSLNDSNIIARDSIGLSGCINIYDSIIENLSVYIENAKCEDALNLVRTKGSIIELNIKNSLFDGIDADFSDLTLNNIRIINSNNDCMDFSYGNYVLNDLNLKTCGDKAVSTGERSILKIENFIIEDSMIGIASKDSAIVNSKNGSIKDVDKCLSIYKKKQEFNGGMLKYKNLNCQNYNVFAFKDNYSKIIEVN
ncbi:hypothetical protein N9341_03555 [Candidatus Pelagibacter sp.]|nr:hypothetical protein [Candidatus Pelagibacter sp.]